MKKTLKRALGWLLTAAMLVSAMSLSALAASVPVNNFTDTGTGTDVKIVSKKNYSIVPGVTETDIIMNDATGDSQVMGYMTSISTDADVSLKATYSGYYDQYSTATKSSTWTPGSWSLNQTSYQAATYEKATGENVVFATNGDYFNMQTGQPTGPLFMNGVNCNPDRTAAEPYFAVLKDGTYAFRDAGTDTSDVAEAVGSPFFLVKDGQNVMGVDDALYPVNSIGMKADGTLVFFMADGRQYPSSVGMTTHQLADFLVAQGVVVALYLDGGGSATVMSQREGEDTLSIRNSPSDGSERSISSGFLLVANADRTGEFDHASVSPVSNSYTPGSEVTFTATGVDSAGGAAALPESGLAWTLAKASASMGTIDAATGVFTSNGTVGDVTVQLTWNGSVVGESSITITEPDQIYFNSSSVSLDFGEESDLGLVVRSNNVDIGYRDNDFTWSVEPEIGTFSGNLFTAKDGTETLSGTVKVSYTKADGTVLTASVAVEIGKMPVVAFDFEADEDGNPETAAHMHWGYTNFAAQNGGYYGDYSTLNVITSGSNTDSPVYSELSWPTDEAGNVTSGYLFTGNYNTAVPAGQIYKANGYKYYLWPNGTITTYLAGSLNLATEATGGQVRFGDYSLELNYDYESYDGSKNANYYIRYCGEDYTIEGMPTKAGVWVYADASAHGYLTYCDIEVWTGSGYTTKNMVLYDPEKDVVNEDGTVTHNNVITFTGWKYLEADLSSLAAYYSPEHPYKILNGYGLFWLSYQPGKNDAGRKAGTLYYDNYRFVYGTDLDDLDNPVINSVSVNGTAIDAAGSAVINSSDVEITTTFADADGKNASGVDATATSIKVDGNEIKCDGDDASALTRLSLGNGLHSVTVTVYDEFGNYATETDYFTVQAEAASGTATLSGADTVTMGSDYALTLATEGTVSAVDATVIQINSDFGEPTVTFAEGWTGESTYTSTGFKKAKMTIKAEWTGEGDVPADAAVATLGFTVPTDMDPDFDYFTYQVSTMTCTLSDGTTATASQPMVKLSLSAYYTVTASVAVAGYDTLLTVTDPDGAACADVEVFVNGESIGNTDENGQITAEVSKALAQGDSFTVNAQNGNHVSFTTTITVMGAAGGEDGKPIGTALSASKDGSTEETITWMSSSAATAAAAYVRYALTEDMTDAVTAEGTSTLHAFSTTKDASRINVAKLSALTPGTTYYYQVGDGQDEHWSEVASFKTTAKDTETTTFFVVGDTQMSGDTTTDAESIALLDQIGENVAGCDFGIQTGDYVDNGGNYAMWEEIQNEFGQKFSGMDMIHTLGNHEYYGDSTGSAAENLFDLDEAEEPYYSVEYGNVYVAVINNCADLQAAADWLVEDASASTATWKILSIHEPAYYTNANDGKTVNEIIPPAAEKAGINAVFSGHDHSYARTQPMTAGQVDTDQGITYFICGDLGEKSRNVNYAAVDNPAFNFAYVSQEYDAIYIKVTAGTDTMQVTTCDADGSILDTCVIEKYDPCKKGHTWETFDKETGIMTCSICGATANVAEEKFTGTLTDINTGRTYEFTDGVLCANGHTWVTYDRSTGLLLCDVCGATASAADELFSGWIADAETGRQMYFIGGTYRTGYIYDKNQAYYIEESGLAFDGDYEMCGETVTFADGQYVAGSNENVLLAGLAGETADFIVTADGTLVIDGTGATYDHNGNGTIQWGSVSNKITSVEIGAGITELGSNTLGLLYKNTAVTFAPDSQLTKVGAYGLSSNQTLDHIILPDTVKSIGDRAFYNSPALTLVYVPDSVHFIGTNAFYKSTNVVLSVGKYTYAESWAKNAGVNYVVRGSCEEHTWSDWTTVAEVTEEADGVRTRYCTVCGEVENEAITKGVFDDVTRTDYYFTPVTWAVESGITNGTSSTTFSPNGKCTRAQAITFIWRAAGEPEPQITENPFTDISESDYYYNAVLWAVETGVTNGTSSTTFSPNVICSRAQVMTFIWRAAGKPEHAETTENPFTDVSDSDYYYDAVLWAVEMGITNGTSSTTFGPTASCLRGQVVTFLYRCLVTDEISF